MTRLGFLLGTAALAVVSAACTGEADIEAVSTVGSGGLVVPGGSGANSNANSNGNVDPGTTPSPGAGASCGPVFVNGGVVGPATQPTTCQRPAVKSALPESWLRSLGTRTTGETVSFTVPTNVQSVTIISQAITTTDTFTVQASTIPNGVVPDMITGPDATVYWNDTAPTPADGTQAFLMANGLSPSTGVVGMPNTSAMLKRSAAGIPTGTWSFKVNDWSYECATQAGCGGGNTGNKYDVQVLFKPGPAKATGVLDVAFYLVVNNGLTAASAIQNASVRRMVNTLNAFYQRAGICLGKVTFYDVPQWAKTKYATGVDASKAGACDDLGQMFTLSQAGNTMNLFLVQSLTSPTNGGGSSVVGVDGSIPGPSSYSGGVRSGAAVSAADIMSGNCGAAIDVANCGADFTAYIAAHEGGHWLGLYHTTEAPGDTFDPISDSGPCACSQCAPPAQRNTCAGQPGVTAANAHLMMVNECSAAGANACGGGNNLMFWLIGGTGQLSAEQGQIMRANPLIQ